MIDTPDFATKLGIWTVSNQRSKDRAKDFFEKIHVRPQISKAEKVLRNKQSTTKEQLEAKDVLYRLRDGRGSANMAGGTATQVATDLNLVMDKQGKTVPMAEAIHAGIEHLQAYQPNGDADEARKEKYLEELPIVVEHAVKGLQEAMASDNRILGEIELLKPLPGLQVPYHTKPDYNRRGDLKTKWSRPSSRSKSGWQAGSLPSSLTGMFDMNNVFQAAGFWALNGNLPPFIVYANATDYRVFTPENAPELRDDFLQDVINEATLYHRTTENLLKASATKEELFSLVSPDWSAIYWQETQTYLDEAKKLWGMI